MKRVGIPLCTAMLLASGGAGAAVTPNSPVTPQTPKDGYVQFTSSSTQGTYVTLYTAGGNGSKCVAMWEDNNDLTTTHLVTTQIVNSSTKYGGVAIQTVTNAGFGNLSPPQNMMAPTTWVGLPTDSDGNPYMFLVSGDTLQATFTPSVTTGVQIDIHVICADF